jgi:hypothetical protein
MHQQLVAGGLDETQQVVVQGVLVRLAQFTTVVLKKQRKEELGNVGTNSYSNRPRDKIRTTEV